MASQASSTASRVLPRIVLAILVVALLAFGGAALMHASIEPEPEATDEPASGSQRT